MGVKIKLLDFVKEENANKSNETDARESGAQQQDSYFGAY